MKKKINILIVHSIGEFSGSLKSLEEYLSILNKKYNFFFLTPSGKSAERLKKYGHVIKTIGLSKFDNSIIGHYRSLRWLVLIREVFLIFPTLFSALLIKRKIKNIDIIHFNEITLIPTIFIFKLFFSIPFILHCRILFKKNNYFGRSIGKYLKKNVSKIIAIDNDVKNSLPRYLKIEVVRNILSYSKIKSRKNFSKKKYLNIGYIGSFLKYKGLEDLILSFNNLTKKNRKIKLYLAGNLIPEKWYTKIFKLSNNIDKNLINSKNVFDLGHLDNIQDFYNKIDIICFPSYLNALGRQIFEAGLYSIPSIVCLKKKNSDSFIHNKTGLSFKKPGDLKKLENIIEYFYKNRKQTLTMGKKAKILILKNYSVEKNIKKLDNIYLDYANKIKK